MQPNCSSTLNHQFYLRFLINYDDIQNLESNHDIHSQSKLYQSQPTPLETKRKVKQKSTNQRKQKVYRISRQFTLPDSQQYGKQKLKIKRVRNGNQRECSLNQHKINKNNSQQLYHTSPQFLYENLMVQKDPSQLEEIEVIQMMIESEQDDLQMEVKHLGEQFQRIQIREDRSDAQVSQNAKERHQFQNRQNIDGDHPQ